MGFILKNSFQDQSGFLNLNASAYDSDALAYFTTAGITDSTAKTQINSFVIGVKGLELWPNMVCWSLRSSQNASSTLYAYSLGGLSSRGDLTNSGLSYTPNGMTSTNNNAYIKLSSTLPVLNYKTLYSVFNIGVFSDPPNYYSIQINDSVSTNVMYNQTVGNYGRSARFPLTSSTNQLVYTPVKTSLNTNHSYLSTVNGANMYLYQDSTQIATSAYVTGSQGTAWYQTTGLCREFVSGSQAFAFLSTDGLTATQTSDLDTLYKSTIGIGLP